MFLVIITFAQATWEGSCFFFSIQVTAYQKWVEQQQHCGNVAAERATNKTATFQWPFQDPKLEVPSIYKAYVRPM